MFSKTFAAVAAGLCLTWGVAYAAGDPAATPEAAGEGGDMIVIEAGPAAQGGGAEDAAAMQMLLLQLLMIQNEMSGGDDATIAPSAAPLTAI